MKSEIPSDTVSLCVHEDTDDARQKSNEGELFKWNDHNDFVAIKNLSRGSVLWISSEFAYVKKLLYCHGEWEPRSPDQINKLLYDDVRNRISMNFWRKFPRIECPLRVMGEKHDAMHYLRNVQKIKTDDLAELELMIVKISKFSHACESNCELSKRQYHFSSRQNTCGLFELYILRDVKAGEKLTMNFQAQNDEDFPGRSGIERKRSIEEFGDTCVEDNCVPCTVSGTAADDDSVSTTASIAVAKKRKTQPFDRSL